MTLSDEGERRQREKQPAHPMAVDPIARIAVVAQQLQDHMDDKYMALHDEIAELYKRLGMLERRPRWWHGMIRGVQDAWWRLWHPIRYVTYEAEDDE